MGKLKTKIEVKEEFILACKEKKLKWKFIKAIHLKSGKGKVWQVKFECSKNHQNQQLLSNFRKKAVCLKCLGLNLNREERIEILSKKHDNFYKYDDFEYKGSKGIISIFCPTHNGKFKQRYQDHARGQRCGICFGNISKTGEQIIKLVELHSNGFVSAVEIDKNKKYKEKEKVFVKCNVHNWHKVHTKKISKIRRGVKCSFCNASKYELVAYYTLHQLGVSFEIEHQIKYKGNIHYVDIVLKKSNNHLLFIEIDGEQHTSGKNWEKSKTKRKAVFLKLKKKDKEKDRYAKSKGIELIRINYKENIKEKIISIINKNNIKKTSKSNKKFPFNKIKTSEKIAHEIHKMYNNGESYTKIRSKFNVIDSYISNVVTGEKFKELFFYLYPDGDNPNIRRVRTKNIRLTKEEDKFLKKEVKKGKLFADIRKEFSIKFRPITRGQFDRYAKKNKFKTPYFINLSKKQIIKMKNLRTKGFSYKHIASVLNKDGIKITRPTVKKKLTQNLR